MKRTLRLLSVFAMTALAFALAAAPALAAGTQESQPSQQTADFTLKTGDNPLVLTVKVDDPSATLEWTSSDTSVCTIGNVNETSVSIGGWGHKTSSAEISAVSEGRTTISVKNQGKVVFSKTVLVLPGLVKHTITFQTNGGGTIDAQTVFTGHLIAKPSDPTRPGYVFKGWFTDAKLTKQFDFTTKVTANLTLYAKWEKQVTTPTTPTTPSTPTTPATPTTPTTPTTPQAKGVTMYRLYNPNSGEHFYTADTGERDWLVGLGWRSEGIGWVAPKSGDAVFRMYNPNAGDHHYTASKSERDDLIKAGWKYEGIGWYSGGSVPLYRQYNPNAVAGAHNYTTSKSENDHLVSVGWRAEGIGWYAVAAK